jgi:hypothetical protein
VVLFPEKQVMINPLYFANNANQQDRVPLFYHHPSTESITNLRFFPCWWL